MKQKAKATWRNFFDRDNGNDDASGAYLVDRRFVEAFQAQVAMLEQAYPELAFLVTGPWPAYHFVQNSQQIKNL